MPNVHAIRAGILDERLIAAEIERHLGAPPLSMVQHPTKLPRFVYEAELPDGQRVIFKAEHDTDGDDAIVLETWAMERAREAGVPAPPVLALDSSQATFPGRYAIFERIPGQSLESLDPPPATVRRIMSEAGAMLRRLHTVRVRGYGELDDARYLRTGEVRGRHDRWVAEPAFEAADYLREHGIVDVNEHAAIRAALELHRPWLEAHEDARLLHGDFDSSHIFVDPGTHAIAGIIDFGDREAGDPVWDLTAIGLWDDAQHMRWAIEGYAPDLPADVLNERLGVYALARLLCLAADRHADGRARAAASLVARVRASIAAGDLTAERLFAAGA
jgi:aminoglycoside phosphotransferase (APT) family kinase protein